MKRISCFLFVIILTAFLIPQAAAAGSFVIDDAELLTPQETQALQETILEIVQKYEVHPMILTVWSLDGKSPQQYAEDYFLQSGYGAGTERSGILFLVSMEFRDWAIVTHGLAMDVVTDSDIDDMVDVILDDLSDGSYYNAFDRFLSEISAEYQSYDNRWMMRLCIALLIGAVAAAITVFIMRRGMNTVRQQSGAADYLTDGSYQLYRCHDFFLYSRTKKVRKAESSGSGGSRGGGSRSFGGRSGKF